MGGSGPHKVHTQVIVSSLPMRCVTRARYDTWSILQSPTSHYAIPLMSACNEVAVGSPCRQDIALAQVIPVPTMAPFLMSYYSFPS